MIKVNKICCTINKENILKEISFDVKRGAIMGLIGRNGSGKTVLLKVLAGLIKFDKGEVLIEGENVSDEGFQKKIKISSVLEIPNFYASLSGRQTLVFYSKIMNVPKTYIDDIIEELNMEVYIDKKVKNYSLGMKQMLLVAQAFIQKPQVLLLDEPFNGLDYRACSLLKQALQNRRKKGMTILISSHDSSCLKEMCNDVIIINNGSVLYNMMLGNENKICCMFKLRFEEDIEEVALLFKQKYNAIYEKNQIVVRIKEDLLLDIIEEINKHGLNITKIEKFEKI